jgi:hypothetical protein
MVDLPSARLEIIDKEAQPSCRGQRAIVHHNCSAMVRRDQHALSTQRPTLRRQSQVTFDRS